MTRYRVAIAAAAGASSLLLSAGSAFAVTYTGGELTRYNACMAIDTNATTVATYDPGTNSGPQDDSCTVVSTATTLDAAITQVNNPRAAKAVNRVVTSEVSVTTTQEYRWQVGQNARWVAFGDPLTAEEIEIISQCMETPGATICQ